MANWGNGAVGAGTGALYGSSFGPMGALVGGGLGGLLGLFSSKRKEPERMSTMDPMQQKLYEQYMMALNGGGGPLADLFGQQNPEEMRKMFDQQYAQPAYQQFERGIVPGITGQFRGGNLQNSSYLGGALAQAGTDVQNNLNGNMANMMYQDRQAGLNRRAGGANALLGMNTFDYKQPQPDMFESLLASLSQGAGSMLANKFNAPGGARIGG